MINPYKILQYVNYITFGLSGSLFALELHMAAVLLFCLATVLVFYLVPKEWKWQKREDEIFNMINNTPEEENIKCV